MAFCIVQKFLLLDDGCILLKHILSELFPSLGVTSTEYLHDMVSNLFWISQEDIPLFHSKVWSLEAKIRLSNAVLPPTRIRFKYLQQLATAPALLPYISGQQAILTQLLYINRDTVPYPHLWIQDVYQFLLDAGAPMNPTHSSLSPSCPVQNNTQHMILVSLHNQINKIPHCDCCHIHGHTADTCGSDFQPKDLQHIIMQYNMTYGMKPSIPVQEKWCAIPPKALYLWNWNQRSLPSILWIMHHLSTWKISLMMISFHSSQIWMT